jgi:CheY-like chemotaxis protein
VERGTPRRILVVDDTRDSADSLATLLQLNGHVTSVSYDGPATVAAAEAFRPDAILLDIGLPGLTGYDVARRIRAQPWGSTVMLIAMTGWGQPEAREEARMSGFDAHLVKPVELTDIETLLRTGRGGQQ